MTTHARGTFKVTSWKEETYEELADGAKMTRASVVQDFAGGLEASGALELLMCYVDDGTATFVGFQRFVGRIGDRSGSFVVQSIGAYDGKQATSTLSVIPHSGTEGLRGLRGEGSSTAGAEPPGSYDLTYDLD